MSSGGIIYAITDIVEPNRVRYIGLTTRGLKRRSSDHWAESRNPKRPINWFMRKRGDRREDVEFSIVGESDTLKGLEMLERYLIRKYREVGQADLNLADGGEGATGVPWSDERRALSREERRERLRGPKPPSNVKLTWDQVDEIRRKSQTDYLPPQEASSMYGVGEKAIRDILSNRTWTDEAFDPNKVVPIGDRHGRHSLTWADVRAIREEAVRGWVHQQVFADRYRVSQSVIANVLGGRRYKDPEFDPSKVVRRPPYTRRNNVKVPDEQLEVLRDRYDAGENLSSLADEFGVSVRTAGELARRVRRK